MAEQYTLANMDRYGRDPLAANFGGMGMGMGMPPGYYYDDGMLGGGWPPPPRRRGRRRMSGLGPLGGRGYPDIGGGYPDFYDDAFIASGTPPLVCPPVNRYGPPRRRRRGDYGDYDDLDDWSDFDDYDDFLGFSDELDDVDLPYRRSHGLLGGGRRYGGRRREFF